MKKPVRIFTCALLAFIMVFCAAACDNGPQATSIRVSKLPNKTEYFLNETFSAEGGEITAVMKDGTEQVVSMTDEHVQLSKVKTTKAGEKTITVSYGGARVRFKITVKVQMFTVSFDLGTDELPAIEPLQVAKDAKIDADKVPQTLKRDGYEFDGWFLDDKFTEKYDPALEVTSDLTLYAHWLDVRAVYYTVKFDGNYYGSKKASAQKVEEGKNASEPKAPTRPGYAFDGWFMAADGDTKYDFAAVTADVTVYAHWTKTATGTNEYIFEGEDIDFTGKRSNGFSGTATGIGLICVDSTGTASNGRYIGWTYSQGLTLEFYFASDKKVDDAKIVVRLSAEFGDMTLSPDMFGITLNDDAISYAPIKIDKVPTGGSRPKSFEDFTIAINAPIVEGANKIVFSVDNSDNWLGEGQGTIGGTAPLIDCVKITTEAVLYWDGTFDLPKKNYR